MKRILLGIWAIVALGLPPFCASGADAWYWTGEAGNADWCTSMNWVGRRVPLSGDTAIFRAEGAVYTNVILTCNTAVARVRLASSAFSPRIVKIGPAETSDRTLTINGTAEALTIENTGSAGPGIDLTFSGEPNGNGARLRMRNSSFQPWHVLATGSSLIVDCDVSGTHGINKTGVGTVYLGGNNSFAGENVISFGRIIIGHPNALGLGGFNPGAGKPGTVVQNFTTLDLAGTTNVNEIVTLNGVGLGFLGGALINSSNALASFAAGMMTSISVTDGGSGYSNPVTVSITGGGGSGATATAELGLSHESITLTSGGIGYSTPPTVYFFGGGGSGAQAVAVVDTNTTEVVDILITNPGSGYSSAPLVVLAGGDGVEAEAVANATNFTIVGTTLLTPGSGYTSPPTVSFSGGGTATATANLASVIVGSAGATIGGTGPIAIHSVVTGEGVLTKRGDGALVLTGDNTYNAGTIINEGFVLANNTNGSATGPGVVTVNGGLLSGTGAVGGPVVVNSGGQVSAGGSVGRLTLAGGLDLSAGGTNVWELLTFKDDQDGVAGVDYDQLALTGGALDLSGDAQLFLKFIGTATAPYSTEPFWQSNHTWTILTTSPPGANLTNLPFANIVNGIYNAGNFSNYVAADGGIVLTYTANPLSKPIILAQPESWVTNWGRPAGFHVTALGSDPISYQWYFQAVTNPIAGATNASYSLTSVDWTNAGDYFAIITNLYGSATTDVAVLTVVPLPPPEIQALNFVGTGTTNVVLTWSAVAGTAYQLQYNTNLNTTNWFVISNVVANGPTVSVAHRRLARDPQRFYRIIAP